MADNTTTATVRPEDTTSVGSRISWGAVLAGVVVALAVYLLLTTLGAAIGVSIGGNMGYRTLVGGGLVWAILTTALSLFAGGWTMSQLTAGETKCESMIHGMILWGTIVAAMMWLTAAGVRSGFNAMLGVAYASNSAAEAEGGWEPLARTLGYSDRDVERLRDTISKKAEGAPTDEATMREMKNALRMITWGTLFGMLLSMGAAIGGALVGAGPSRTFLWAGRPPLQRTTAPTERQLASHI